MVGILDPGFGKGHILPLFTYPLPSSKLLRRHHVQQSSIAFSLHISFRNGHLVLRHERFTKWHILLEIPKVEVVVKDVMMPSGSLSLHRIAESIVQTPDMLQHLKIRARDVIQGIHLVVILSMGGLMHFRDGRDELLLQCWVEFTWPNLGDVHIQIDISLAANIVTDEDEGEKGELEECRSEGIIHISISISGYQLGT